CDSPRDTRAKHKDDSDQPRQGRGSIHLPRPIRGRHPPVGEILQTQSAQLGIALSFNHEWTRMNTNLQSVRPARLDLVNHVSCRFGYIPHVDSEKCQWYRRANLRGSPQKAGDNTASSLRLAYIVKQSGSGAKPPLAGGEHLL